MNRGILYTATAGFLGAFLWMGVAYATMYEYDLLAFVIGLGVGLAALFGFEYKVGAGPMATAFIFTALALVGGKYFTVEMLTDPSQADAQWAAEAERVANDEEYAMTYMADQVIREYTEQGKPVNYPLTANLDFPESARDYPTDVWNEANRQWQAMTKDEQQAFLDVSLKAYQDYELSQADEIKQAAFADLLDGKAMVLILLASGFAAAMTRANPKQGLDPIDPDGDDSLAMDDGDDDRPNA